MLVALIFVVGYLAIVLEHPLRVNKSAVALVMGVACWTAALIGADAEHIRDALVHHLGDVSQVLFFLLAAMTIVELVDAHDGFTLLTSRVSTTSRRGLLVTLSSLAFVLSSVLDNLTTAIVMVSLVRRLVTDREDRLLLSGAVVVAANAGGVWSPIGDVTTTMLWVGDQITTTRVIGGLLVPALVSVVVPIAILARGMKGAVERPPTRIGPDTLPPPTVVAEAAPGLTALTTVSLPPGAGAVGKTLAALDLRARTGASVVTITRNGIAASPSAKDPIQEADVLTLAGSPESIDAAIALVVSGETPKPTTPLERRLVLFTGVGVLLFVPVFKTLTHLPPVMGILLGLGVLWTLTEVIHKRKNDDLRGALSVSGALQRIDAQSIFFFLGILLAVSALDTRGLLTTLATAMDRAIGNVDAVTLLIGLASSVVDNVPLVAAAQGMYPLSTFPTDHRFWVFLAYCSGTGGSILIIGSAAGVAVMGMERIGFGWYLRRISLPALIGYAAGAAVFLAFSARAP